jgi:hypothetical protein
MATPRMLDSSAGTRLERRKSPLAGVAGTAGKKSGLVDEMLAYPHDCLTLSLESDALQYFLINRGLLRSVWRLRSMLSAEQTFWRYTEI